MTNPDYTALLLIIDRSGSMESIRDDMVGGLETMLARQSAEPGLLTVDIVTFDTEIETQAHFAAPDEVKIELLPRGATALFDAIGIGVTTFGVSLAALPESERPGIVQVVVVTDGYENSSTEWRASSVRKLVRTQIDVYDWDFVYLGANQDAVLTGAELGFDAGSSLTYDASSAKVGAMVDGLDRYVSSLRASDKQLFTAAERNQASAES